MALFFIAIIFLMSFTGISLLETQNIEIQPLVSQVAFEFSRVLDYHLNNLTNYKILSEKFNNASNYSIFGKTNGQEILDKFTNDIDKIFSDKKVLLKNLQENVASFQKEHTYNPKIEDFFYLSSRFVNNSNKNDSYVNIVTEFPTDVPINLTQSFVHVPTNIYENNKYILNTVKWTKRLDEVFKKNKESPENNDSSVIAQYYCDTSGLLRMYPGNVNGLEKTSVDLYDCRRRLWYQQSAASPKDVVILLDRSGSMTGINFVIAKIAAKSIIDTLHENDYFNIVTVNDSAVMVTECIKNLIRATKFNKEKIKTAINNISEPSGVLNIEVGIGLAFKTLNSGHESNRTYSAHCNKIIMFFSDGIEGDYSSTAQNVFDKLNMDKSVRVFTYLVGRVKNPYDRVLKGMSCKNRGHFYQIQTLGNVWDTVIQYLEVLSRPMVKYQTQIQSKISPIYLDSSGAGMVITMSLGVFNSTDFVGVVGLDMLIRALTQVAPISELGYFSHTVIINSNGFVVQHLKYLDQTGYLPLPTNVYFEDLEHSVNMDDSKKLRERILKGENASTQLLTYWLYDGNKITENNVTYYFKPVFNSTLYITLAISNADVNNVTLKKLYTDYTYLYKMGVDALSAINNLDYYTYVDIPNWRICNNSANRGDATLDLKVYPNANELRDYLLVVDPIDVLDENDPVCDTNLTLDLLLSAALAIGPINESWRIYFSNTPKTDPNFMSVFVCTGGGYTRYFSLNNSKPGTRDELRKSVFEKAVAMADFSIIASTPVRSVFKDEVLYIQILASTWMEREGERVLMAVSGVEINSGFLKQIFNNATTKIAAECANNNSYTCAVIDLNGFILVSNQGGRAIGNFFGSYHSKLMYFFVEKGIFRQIFIVDRQASCIELIYNDSSSSILLTPAKMFINILLWLLNSLWSLLVQIFLYAALLVKSSSVSLQSTNSIKISCSKKTPFFLFQNNTWNEFKNQESNRMRDLPRGRTLLSVECSPSSIQYFSLASVPNTNLLFLFVTIPSGSNCNEPMNRVADIDQINEFCNQTESFRNYTEICYSKTVLNDEEPEHCGKCNRYHSSFILISVQITTFFIFQQF